MTWVRHRLLAIAAHLALWLAIVAPVISQVIAQPQLAMSCGVLHQPLELPLRLASDAISSSTLATAPHTHDGVAPDEPCGYCSLFAHLPLALTIAACLATLPALPYPRTLVPAARVANPPTGFAFEAQGPPTTLS